MSQTLPPALHELATGIFDASRLDLPPAVRLACGDRIFEQPIVISMDEMDDFARDLEIVFDAIVELPSRLFDGDWARFACAVDVPDDAARFMAQSASLPLPRYGRADMHHDGESFRLLELNVGSEIGGLERAGLLPAAFLAQLSADHPQLLTGLTASNTHAMVASALVAAAPANARRPGVRPPHQITVGLVDAPESRRQFQTHWSALAEVFGEVGLPVVVGDLDSVVVVDDDVRVEGIRVDIVLRYASVEEILAHPGGEQTMRAVIDCARRERVTLWTPPHSNAFGSKACLALLSDEIWATSLSEEQRGAVGRIVPWTRSLQPGLEGRSAQAHAHLVSEALHGQESLVLKPSNGHGGEGVIVGREVSAPRWAQAVTRAADGQAPAVVQRLVPARAETFAPELGLGPSKAAYGAFLTPDGFAGAYGRVVPIDHGAVVGMSSSPQTKTAAVVLSNSALPGRKDDHE